MNVVLAAFGGIALLAALALLWWRRTELRQLALMESTPTSRAGDVAALTPGSALEIKGTLRCSAPLLAEFSQRSCTYFKAEIIERRVTHTTGSDGKKRSNTVSTPLHSNSRFALCTVEDESGRVALSLEGATVEGQQVVDRTESPGGELAKAVTAIINSDRVTHHHVETILPHDIPVYVLGEVQADHSVGKPAKGSKNSAFIVSMKSEEQRSAEASATAKWLLVAACVLILAAAGLLVWALMKGPA